MSKPLPNKAQIVLAGLIANSDLKFRRSPQGYFKIIPPTSPTLASIHRKTLLYSLHNLFQLKLVDIVEGLDGVTIITPTAAGKQLAEATQDLSIPEQQPSEWDRKWRLVLLDVPELKKRHRENFRYRLRRLGFQEFQRSAFLFPYPCAKAVDALASQCEINEHVTMITAESISNDFEFKKKFGLL